MISIRPKIRTLISAFIATAMLVPAAGTLAKDVLHLKDGRVLEGEIVREVNGSVQFEISIGDLKTTDWFLPTDIKQIIRDESVEEEEVEELAIVVPDGATKVCFITLEDTVGPYFNKDAIEHSIELLDELPESDKPDIIVFQINSGGGALNELLKIAPYIQEEVKPNYRTVAWIRSAISAAAMSCWVVEDIYMMRHGNIGACTGYSMPGGKAEAMSGDSLEQILVWMERVSSWGNHPWQIMRAMQVYATLSATKDEHGNVEWFLDDSGEKLVSPEKEILTFNALQAVEWKLARAIADNKDELAKAMGLTEWVEVGHEADEYQQEFRENVKRGEVKLDELLRKLNLALSSADSAPTEKFRNRNIGEARQHLRAMRGVIRRAPSLANPDPYIFSPKWFREVEQSIKDMAKEK